MIQRHSAKCGIQHGDLVLHSNSEEAAWLLIALSAGLTPSKADDEGRAAGACHTPSQGPGACCKMMRASCTAVGAAVLDSPEFRARTCLQGNRHHNFRLRRSRLQRFDGITCCRIIPGFRPQHWASFE